MLTEIIMPKLGLTMEEGAVVRWYKPEGAKVERGETLVDIETDKTVVEVEVPTSGYLRSILLNEGASGVPVGTLLALISTTADEPISSESVQSAALQAPVAAPDQTESTRESVFQASEGEGYGPRASPAARRVARELKVDLAKVTGTGTRGLISVEDVEKAAAVVKAAIPVAQDDRTVPLNGMRRAIARTMLLSHQTVPVFILRRNVRVGRLLETYKARKAELHAASGLQMTITDLLLHAAAATLRRHPMVNASFVGDPDDAAAHIVQHGAVNIGLAVSTDAGLVVPVIRDASNLDLRELAQRRENVVSRARAGRLKADELSGGTFSVSNLGGQGVDSFTAVINPPEAAILAVGRVIDKLVVEQGKMTIEPTMDLSLTADHRVLDGAQGAAFLVDLVKTLELASFD